MLTREQLAADAEYSRRILQKEMRKEKKSVLKCTICGWILPSIYVGYIALHYLH